MGKLKLFLIFVVLNGALSLSAKESCEFRVFLSNQSYIESNNENITLSVNGVELFSEPLSGMDQHHYEGFKVECAKDIKQWVSATANDANVFSKIGIDTSDINNDMWVIVEYLYDEKHSRGYFTFVTGHGIFFID